MAITRAAPAISEIVNVRPFLRPCRSAYAPSTAPPIGRMMKPTANTARVDSRATVGSPEGKNWPAKIGAKALYTAQSTHSTALPIEPASRARRWAGESLVIESVGTATGAATVVMASLHVHGPPRTGRSGSGHDVVGDLGVGAPPLARVRSDGLDQLLENGCARAVGADRARI